MNSMASDPSVTAPMLLLAVVPTAAVAGRLLTWSVSRLVEPARDHFLVCRSVEVLSIVAAVALWWWECVAKGQLPTDVVAPPGDVAVRYAGHLILFCFLAAAAWVDFRHRVIPDAITVPGALCGLAWNALFPRTLPPITTFVERSFATPEAKADALGMVGGIAGTMLPAWLSGPVGLPLAAICFAIWWWFGTSPDDAPPFASSRTTSPWRLSGPVAAGLLGSAIVIGSWIVGGAHWAGLVASLAGVVVAGSLIWTTRAGASWALGREAMGFGDVTLMAMAGAWLGWQACVMACMIGVFIGLFHGVFQLLSRSETELPFGPSLCLGLVVVVIGWRFLWEWAGPQFEQPLELAIVASLVIALTALTLWAWSKLRGIPTRPDE